MEVNIQYMPIIKHGAGKYRFWARAKMSTAWGGPRENEPRKRGIWGARVVMAICTSSRPRKLILCHRVILCPPLRMLTSQPGKELARESTDPSETALELVEMAGRIESIL
jgi:hypothetical protein